MKKIKVLIFANRMGGSERQAIKLGKRLDRSRFEPVIACFRDERRSWMSFQAILQMKGAPIEGHKQSKLRQLNKI